MCPEWKSTTWLIHEAGTSSAKKLALSGDAHMNMMQKANKVVVTRRDSSSSCNESSALMVQYGLSTSATRLERWIVDSGPTCHTCCGQKCLLNFVAWRSHWRFHWEMVTCWRHMKSVHWKRNYQKAQQKNVKHVMCCTCQSCPESCSGCQKWKSWKDNQVRLDCFVFLHLT